MKQNRVLIIGLDGATFDLIKPWVAEGGLPNLSTLMNSGSYGELESTLHPLTATAWTSFMTGKNPGKHGVYDFITRIPDSYAVQLVNSKTRDPNTLWKILSSHGKKLGVINVPLNYPPEQINGFMISWMDAPSTATQYTYPPELAEELKKISGGYKITVNFDTSLDQYVDDLFELIENRATTAEYLIKNKPWDFFMVLFSTTDFAQHAFWKYMDPNHPQYNRDEAKKYGHVIREVYERIDRKLGILLDQLTENDTVFIMSDHGFGPLKAVINLNKWFEQNGFLTFAPTNKAFFSSLLRTGFGLLKRNLPARAKGFLKEHCGQVRDQIESRLITSYLDWSQTKAFALGAYGNVWINLKGREPQGIVAPNEYDQVCRDVEKKLLALTYKGENVVECVHRKQDIYSGSFLNSAPDLIIQWKDYAYHSRQRFGEEETEIFKEQQNMPMSKLEMNGFHRMNGIFIAKGNHIKQNQEITGAQIIDIAPTLLFLMGLPIEKEMDGKILQTIFTDDFLKNQTISSEPQSNVKSDKNSSQNVYSTEESEVVVDRLKSLGYL